MSAVLHYDLVSLLLGGDLYPHTQSYCLLFEVSNYTINMITCTHCVHVQWGESPIWAASFGGHEECVDQLLKAGANVDVPKEVSVTR